MAGSHVNPKSILQGFLQMNNNNSSLSTPHLPPPPYRSPASAASSDHTYLMATSPVRDKKASDSYRPTIISTVGQRPACLVSASVTYVGNNEIYAFGGFDDYTDEVYNHVLRLNLDTRQWNLVDNFGDIPGVRMGHTATLWQGDKVLIFGGENEHRVYLSDLIIFDLKTAYWNQPDLQGVPPKGRARHSALVHDDKLFIVGGLSGNDNNTILDDFCYLDLKTWTWSRTWRFVPRFDHTCWMWGGRMWVFGGLTEGMERSNDIWWLDMRQSPYFDGGMGSIPTEPRPTSGKHSRPQPTSGQTPSAAGSGYAANSSSVQVAPGSYTASRKVPMAPGSISSLNFVSGAHIPAQTLGKHFHAHSSGCLLDFVTPAHTGHFETSLCALDLETMRWEKLADGKDLFNPNYGWHYCVLNQDGTRAWLLGSQVDPPNNNGGGEYLSDVLTIDLGKLGLLGNSLAMDMRSDNSRMPSSDATPKSNLSGIGADLAKLFDRCEELGEGTDFTVTAEPDDLMDIDDADSVRGEQNEPQRVSRPIFVHRLILEARWPHFARMIAAQMSEFHTKKLHIPEPFSVVRAFLLFLYTDSISSSTNNGPSLEDVAGMLVMANCYDMSRLRMLCRNRLYRELDVEHAAIIWERAGIANEEWLKKRAARFCMDNWGRVVRTLGFQTLRRGSMMEICQEIDTEGRIVGADEFENDGGICSGHGRMVDYNREGRGRRLGSGSTQLGEDGDEPDDDNMEY
ncbi:MAG: hypothetical protein M1831_001838 [Alyxoria varia]|nr:MAG: hypothetical protein M1831_001838 [Alyxoria varia]